MGEAGQFGEHLGRVIALVRDADELVADDPGGGRE
jgi:hypothetical protein